MEHIWIYSATIIFIVVLAKVISSKTNSVDVLWLIILGSIATNLEILPKSNETLEIIGEWGIVFVMFALGFEEDLNNFYKGLKKSWGIAIIGAIFPFLAGFYTAQIFGFSTNNSLVWGLVMTATAVSLTMVSLRGENLHKSRAATGIMTAAVIDDILSLIGVAILVPIILNGSNDEGLSIDIDNIIHIFVKVLIFFFLVIFVGTVLFPDSLKDEEKRKHGIIFKLAVVFRQITGIKRLLLMYEGRFTPLIMIFIALSFGAVAHIFGFHPAIGAYFAGLFLKGEYFEYEVNKEIISHKRDAEFIMNHLAFTIFGPIFFVMLGTKLVFDIGILVNILPIAIVLFLAIFIFQVLSASIAAKYTGGYNWSESLMIGFGMLGRAELAFIVINIAFVQSKIIDLEQFYILIVAVFLLNLSVPISIKLYKPYYLKKNG